MPIVGGWMIDYLRSNYMYCQQEKQKKRPEVFLYLVQTDIFLLWTIGYKGHQNKLSTDQSWNSPKRSEKRERERERERES